MIPWCQIDCAYTCHFLCHGCDGTESSLSLELHYFRKGICTDNISDLRSMSTATSSMIRVGAGLLLRNSPMLPSSASRGISSYLPRSASPVLLVKTSLLHLLRILQVDNNFFQALNHPSLYHFKKPANLQSALQDNGHTRYILRSPAINYNLRLASLTSYSELLRLLAVSRLTSHT